MWTNIIFWLVTTAISYLLRPKPEQAKATTLEDYGVPVTQPGRELPLFGGTVWIDDPQEASSGDFKTEGVYDSGGKK